MCDNTLWHLCDLNPRKIYVNVFLFVLFCFLKYSGKNQGDKSCGLIAALPI